MSLYAILISTSEITTVISIKTINLTISMSYTCQIINRKIQLNTILKNIVTWKETPSFCSVIACVYDILYCVSYPQVMYKCFQNRFKNEEVNVTCGMAS